MHHQHHHHRHCIISASSLSIIHHLPPPPFPLIKGVTLCSRALSTHWTQADKKEFLAAIEEEGDDDGGDSFQAIAEAIGTKNEEDCMAFRNKILESAGK